MKIKPIVVPCIFQTDILENFIISFKFEQISKMSYTLKCYEVIID